MKKTIAIFIVVMLVFVLGGCNGVPTVADLLESDYYDWNYGTGHYISDVYYAGMQDILYEEKTYTIKYPGDASGEILKCPELWEIRSENVRIEFDYNDPNLLEATISFEETPDVKGNGLRYYLLVAKDDSSVLALIPHKESGFSWPFAERGRPFAYFAECGEREHI